MEPRNKDPLHGLTLARMLDQLLEHYGWQGLAERIAINCFTQNPSIKSSLSFLRKTPWARAKLEALYRSTFYQASPWQRSDQP